MAGSLNKVMIIGNVGRDPEVRSFSNGGKVCNLTIATSESWKDRTSGEKKEKTEWHKIAIFGPLADIAERYVVKGTKLYIEGQLQTRKWQDQSGNDKYSTEIVLQGYGTKMEILSAGKQGGGAGSGASDSNDGWGSGGGGGGSTGGGRSGSFNGGAQGGGGFGGGFPDDLDDDVPF